MSPTLHIQLLGAFHLTYGEMPVAGLGTARLHALLAYLALHRDAPQNRQRLAFLFWPDSTEAQARNNLRQMLHQLRHALPDADRFLDADASTVRWRPDAPYTLDVAEFELALNLADTAEQRDDAAAARSAFQRAAELYRADLLLDCYDEWVAPARERLRQCCLRAIVRLRDLLEEQRDYAEAIGYARRLVGYDLLDEDANRRLIGLLAQSGDRAGALRAYHACATILQRELGIEPSEATHEIYERLLRTKARRAPADERQLLSAEATTLIGRRREWALLLDAWRQTAEGPRFVLITGEAGIGKSRLAEELLTWAGQRGAIVARTRSYSAEGRLSLAPVIEWLRSSGLRPHLARLDSVWLTEVA